VASILFDSEIAEVVGVNSAIVFEKIRYFADWAEKNKAKNHFHKGAWWTYNSLNAWVNDLSFLSKKQIRLAIDLLIKNNLIEIGCFNRKHYDKTTWYRTLVTKNVTYVHKGIACAAEGIACAAEGTTIPNKSSFKSSKNKEVVDASTSDASFLINENKEDFDKAKAHFLGVPYYSRIKALGTMRRVFGHYGSFEAIELAYTDLWNKYGTKKRYPNDDQDKQDKWHKDCYSFIENSMIKESSQK
jgi:hypothetical protein